MDAVWENSSVLLPLGWYVHFLLEKKIEKLVIFENQKGEEVAFFHEGPTNSCDF